MKTLKTSGPAALALLLLLSIIAVAMMLTSCTGQKMVQTVPEKTNRFVQVVNKPYTLNYGYSESGTLTFRKVNAIAGLAIMVPGNATDSVSVMGGVMTYQGKATGAIKLGAGESLSLGYNDLMRMDSTTVGIPIHSMPRVVITTVK